MAFSSRTNGWDEGFIASATASAAPVAPVRGSAADMYSAGNGAGGGSSMDPLSGIMSPKRMRAEQAAGSAYAPDLARALKSVVKASAIRAQRRRFPHLNASQPAVAAARHALVQANGACHTLHTCSCFAHPLALPPQIFTTTASPNFSQPWQMCAQSKCTASGFAISPLEQRRILTNAHAVANQVRGAMHALSLANMRHTRAPTLQSICHLACSSGHYSTGGFNSMPSF